MDGGCPIQYAIPHGLKVFAAAFLIAKHLQKAPKPPSNCPPEEIKTLNKDKHLMEHCWRLAPYPYKLTPDAPISSLELLMMLAKRQSDIVNPPKEPEPDLSGKKLHYDYKQVYKHIRL